jgi:hypothetical protein
VSYWWQAWGDRSVFFNELDARRRHLGIVRNGEPGGHRVIERIKDHGDRVNLTDRDLR